MMKKFVFIDIDGTLYDHTNQCIPPNSIKALEAAKANGHELFICTGRPKPIVEESYRRLPISGIVYAGGTHIEVDNRVIYQGKFPQEHLETLLQFFKDNQVAFTLEGAERNVYSEACYKKFERAFVENTPENSEIALQFKDSRRIKLMDELNEEDVAQIMKIDLYAKDDEHIREFMADLPSGLDGFLYSDAVDGEIEGEILIDGISKASGIDRVLEYFGGALCQSVAIGDSTNDMAMIEHACLGIAMGNACEQLKEIADVVTARIEEDGFYQAFVTAGLI